MPRKKSGVTRRRVDLAQATVAADTAPSRPVDPAVRMIAEAGRDGSAPRR